jgi:hypothetical protein
VPRVGQHYRMLLGALCFCELDMMAACFLITLITKCHSSPAIAPKSEHNGVLELGAANLVLASCILYIIQSKEKVYSFIVYKISTKHESKLGSVHVPRSKVVNF